MSVVKYRRTDGGLSLGHDFFQLGISLGCKTVCVLDCVFEWGTNVLYKTMEYTEIV